MPPEVWSFVRAYDAPTLAEALKEVARHVRVFWMPNTTLSFKRAPALARS